MDRLPVEILASIASYLIEEKEENRARIDSGRRLRIQPDLSILSRGWQFAVEQHTFADLCIKSTDLDAFRAAFSGLHGSQRRKSLRRIDFDVVLPDYSDDAFGRLETIEDRAANNKAASSAVTSLLSELSQWHESPGVRLFLKFYSPADNRRVKRKLRKYPRPFYARDQFSYITLSGLETIRVPCVREVSAPEENRTLDPGSMVKLNSVFPRLAEACWTYYEPSIFLTLRDQFRAEFTECLQDTQFPPDTERLCVFIQSPDSESYRFFPASTRSGPKQDVLCTVLHRIISQSNLKVLRLEVPADQSLFWSEKWGSASTWATVESLDIELHPANPFNQWYFGTSSATSRSVPWPGSLGFMPPGYGSEADDEAAVDFYVSMRERYKNSDYYAYEDEQDRRAGPRGMPNDEIMVPVLRAYAQCLAHMPSLKTARLAIRPMCGGGMWSISYKVGQTSSSDSDSDSNSEYDYDGERIDPGPEPERARFTFQVGAWRPDGDLLQLFRSVGKEKYEQEPLVLYL